MHFSKKNWCKVKHYTENDRSVPVALLPLGYASLQKSHRH